MRIDGTITGRIRNEHVIDKEKLAGLAVRPNA
jgi:hypothetical protein